MRRRPFKVHWEAFLLELAARILDRNVERSPVVSRRDNNEIFEIPYQLRAIARRIRQCYESEY